MNSICRVGRVARAGKLDAEAEEVFRTEAEIATRELQEARRQDAGAAQQDQARGDLRDDQPSAHALLRVGASARVGARRAAELRSA